MNLYIYIIYTYIICMFADKGAVPGSGELLLLLVASLIFQCLSLAVFNFCSFEGFVFIKGVFIKQTECIQYAKLEIFRI